MYQYFIFVLFLFLSLTVHAQERLRGCLKESQSNQPVEGATITLLPSFASVLTDVNGCFSIQHKSSKDTSLLITAIGYHREVVPLTSLQRQPEIKVFPKPVELQSIEVAARFANPYKAISATDLALRGISNSQEVLRIVPGTFIGQHQGGGKAEQIFIRGFDADHGTDVRLEVDGMMINLPSHAHGQGYADSHFIIPETIERVEYGKGPYTAGKGDFATAGFIEYRTRNKLDQNLVKVEAGMFHTYRGLAMVDLLQKKGSQAAWYVASEYNYSNAYFDLPQKLNRLNVFTKYSGKINSKNFLEVSASHFWSRWNASGQIPERAVDNGLIGFFGAIDPDEGGTTGRENLNLQLTSSFSNGGVMKNQFYYSRYSFDLYTNFTFFLVDSINGDEIKQKELRDVVGYNGTYRHNGFIGKLQHLTEAGLTARLDQTSGSELSQTKSRSETLSTAKLGNVKSLNLAAYVSESIYVTPKLTVNAGVRYDQFYHQYLNQLQTDPILSGVGKYKAVAGTLSPKLNLYYQWNNQTQFYFSAGKGFHSNDTRVVVAPTAFQVLPGAYGVDAGVVCKPAKNLLLQASLWQINLDQEFVYNGDGGDVSFEGKTRRVGVDMSARFQPIPNLYLDADVNYAHGEVVDEPKGNNRIPLAPVWSSSGGIRYQLKKGFSGSLRYRGLSDRPANEDYSLTAVGYFITDAVVTYSKSNYELGLVVNNVFNRKWKETQFATLTRLQYETAPVDEVCFTPGTPFNARISFTYFFK